MTIDTKRLATDAAYWDSVAPEGATHFNPKSNLARWYDLKESECYNEIGEYWFSSVSLKWSQLECEMIPRPKAPKAEWHGSGKPIIGSEVEAAWRVENGEMSGFRPVLIKGFFPEVDGRAQVWFCTTEGEDIVRLNVNCNFRPIRTKEQRDKEELNEIIDAAMRSGDGDAAAAILAAGWRKGDS